MGRRCEVRQETTYRKPHSASQIVTSSNGNLVHRKPRNPTSGGTNFANFPENQLTTGPRNVWTASILEKQLPDLDSVLPSTHTLITGFFNIHRRKKSATVFCNDLILSVITLVYSRLYCNCALTMQPREQCKHNCFYYTLS